MPLSRRILGAFLALLIVFAFLFTLAGEDLLSANSAKMPSVFIGVDVAFGNETAVYTIANAVYGFSNLIIVGSLNVTRDTAALTRVCDFLFQKGFYFIVYVGFAKTNFLPPQGPDPSFLSTASTRWGNKFLGLYLFDEAGGRQLDSTDKVVPRVPNSTFEARDYSYASEAFDETLTGALTMNANWFSPSPMKSQLFTSDYALYWYDYLGGYGTVFGEFVGDQSRQIVVALDRGAANVFGRNWGTMITYQENGPENPSKLYSDMTVAWRSGAKYIIVFDGNSTDASTSGALTQAHLDEMKLFWNYTKTNKQGIEYSAVAAYVIPADYGCAFRGSSDTIWGLWNADTLSTTLLNTANSLLATYGNNLDIVYQNRVDSQPIALPYKTLIFWNGTTIQK